VKGTTELKALLVKTMQIRLAFRREGPWWNCYLANQNTMDGAKLLGSVLIRPFENNPERKNRYMALMQEILADACVDVFGEKPEKWETAPVPESERSGHA
jgi:hypothetical protein